MPGPQPARAARVSDFPRHSALSDVPAGDWIYGYTVPGCHDPSKVTKLESAPQIGTWSMSRPVVLSFGQLAPPLNGR